MYVSICVYVAEGEPLCVLLEAREREGWVSSSAAVHLIPLRHGLPLTLELLGFLLSLYPPFPSQALVLQAGYVWQWGGYNGVGLAQLLHGCQGSKLRNSCLCSKFSLPGPSPQLPVFWRTGSISILSSTRSLGMILRIPPRGLKDGSVVKSAF